MGIFTKKESVHFERDEAGNVIGITRNGQEYQPEPQKQKSIAQLESEYYAKNPKEKHPTLTKIGGGLAKLDKKIVQYNRTSNIMRPQHSFKPRKKTPMYNNFNPLGSAFDFGMQPMRKPKTKVTKTKYTVVGGKAYPIAGTGKKKPKKKSKSRSSGLDMDYWGLMR